MPDPSAQVDAVEDLDLFDDDLVDVGSLRDGMRLAHDVYDDAGVLLLAAGMCVSSRFLELLARRQIRTVRLRRVSSVDASLPSSVDADQDAAYPGDSTEQSRKLDDLLARELLDPPVLQPVRAWRRPRLPMDALKAEALRGVERHDAVSSVVASAGETLQLGGKLTVGHLRSTMNDFVNMVTLDFDLLPLVVSMQRTKDEYLFDHAVNVALLSMTIGVQLGLNHHQLMDLALAGMLHDVGMLRVPGHIRLAPRKLNSDEVAEIRRHPLYTLDMLEGVRGLPNVVRIIALQVHERSNGSGYPRGRTGSMLHPFSMIVSVADAYAAMTRPRPHREALSPYEGASVILHAAAANQFDKLVVRAFLDAVALVPIGSIVELNTGRRGVVIRANPDMHTCPVIEELDDHDRPCGRIIDLSQEKELRITRAHPTSSNVYIDTAGEVPSISGR